MTARNMWFILILTCVFNGVVAQYTIITTEGGTVQIPCHTKPSTGVNWQYRRWLPASDHYVCIRGVVMGPFKPRFQLHEFPEDKSGNFSLTISHVNVNDSGIYTCAEDDGAGPRHSSRLKVQQAHTYSDSDVNATVGSVVLLRCQTAVQTWVHWVYQAHETSTETTISSEGNVERQYRDQFQLSLFDRGDYTLTINSVGLADSGLYTCIERETNRESRHTVRLNVGSPEPDACLSRPCQNWGSCTSSSKAYTCSCVPGFSGKNCEQDVDECRSSPCRNDGVCVEGVNKFTCVCMAGFTGTTCDNFIGTFHPVSHSTPASTDKSSDSTSATVTGLAVALSFCFAAAVFLLIFVYRTRCVKACKRLLPGHETTPLLKGHKEVKINKYVFVTGVTILDNRLCMLRGHLVQVYETQSHQLIQGRSFPELYRHYRNDITSSETHKSLYISDYIRKYIYKLQLPLQSEMPVHKKNKTNEETKQPDGTQSHGLNVLCGIQYRPSGLSVTASDEILVTCVNDHKLLLLSPDGKTQREIQLASDIELPLHAVQHPGKYNQFFVCHSGDGIWLVEAVLRELNATTATAIEATGSTTVMPVLPVETAQSSASSSKGGDNDPVTVETAHCSIISSYGGQTMQEKNERLGWPCHIAVNKAGYVYVADKYNDRVVLLRLLDQELKFVKVSTELERPRRLCLHTGVKGQELYVGQKNGEVVKIDSIRKRGLSIPTSHNNNKGDQSAGEPNSESYA